MSNGKANTSKTIVDEVVKLNKERAKAFGIARQVKSVKTNVTLGTSGLKGGSDASNQDGFVKTSGDTMVGPLAFYTKPVTVVSGVIDISKATGSGYSSRVIVIGQGGAADDLDTITGAAHEGQLLFLQATNTTPITLKHLTPTTGNIWSPTLGDYVVTDKEIVILQWESSNEAYTGSGGQWSCVANFVASGGGGGGMNTDLSNMTGPTAPTVALNMNGQEIIGVANIDLDGVSATIEGVKNLQFFATSTSINELSGELLYQVNTSKSHTFYIAGTPRLGISDAKLDVHSSGIDINGGSIDDVNIITFNNSIANDYIESTIDGIEYNVNATDEHIFKVGGTEVMRVDSSELDLSQAISMNNNNIAGVAVLQFNTAGQSFTTSVSEILYQVPSGDVHGFYVAAAKTCEITDTYLRMSTGKFVDFGNNISLTASSGALSLPSNPLGFLICRINGGLVRVPYYNT